jgi:L-alanine-DL-glutamate epimerase-like enolase superfamily enzyme
LPSSVSLYYERGLLHPFIDYDAPPPWLNASVDPMDKSGLVHVSQAPGLGQDINWSYIENNRVA